MSVTGDPDRPGYRLGVAITDMVSGLYCAQGITAALLARERFIYVLAYLRGRTVEISADAVAYAGGERIGPLPIVASVIPRALQTWTL